MEFFTSALPIWISILFLIVIPIPVFMIAGRAGRFSQTSKSLTYTVVLVFYALWFLYAAFACYQGWFAEASLPPMILKFTTIPLLLFLIILIFNLPKTKSIIKNMPLSHMVRLHIFRLIGSFFIILALFKALPNSIGFIAGFGDVITAITSLFVAKAIDQGKSYARPLTWAWNTFGILDIFATSGMAMMLTRQSMQTGSLGVDVLGQFPFCFIPAFAPATIIFLHLCIYRKLLMKDH